MKPTLSPRRRIHAVLIRAERLRPHVLLPLLLLCALLPAGAAPSVVILSPKPQAVVHGAIQVVAAPSAEATAAGFSYATLFVDAAGRSISNTLPLRFSLDTTNIPNGLYVIRVDTYNNSGGFQGSASVPITVFNAPVETFTNSAPVAPMKRDAIVQPQAAKSTAPPAATPVAPALLLDGKLVSTIPPMTIEGGRAIVTLRPLITVAGGTISWDAAKQQVTVRMGGRTIVLIINESTAMVDGKPVDLGMPVRVAQGRTLVPATAWRTVFGGGVEYNSEIRCVMLSTNTAYLASARLDR